MNRAFLILFIFSGLFLMVGCSLKLPSDYQNAIDAYESNSEFKEWFIMKKNSVDNA